MGSYQASGHPYITGSATIVAGAQDKIAFPMVTRSVTVINRAAPDLRVHFRDKDVGNTVQGLHYITLTDAKDSVTMNVKCKEIYISNADGAAQGAYEVFAELTGIPTKNMYELTGSGITE